MKSIDQLWREHHAGLRRFVARRMPDMHDAEDILQDVLVRAQESLHQLKSVDRTAAWLARIAANRIIDLRITTVRRQGDTLTVGGLGTDNKPIRLTGIDEIVCATGQRPNLETVRELRLKLDPWLESSEALGPLIDPNLHSCGSVRPHGHREPGHPEKGFYSLGVKSYGRAPTFLMATSSRPAR